MLRQVAFRAEGPAYTSLGQRPRNRFAPGWRAESPIYLRANDESGLQPSLLTLLSRPWAALKAGIDRAFGPQASPPELTGESRSSENLAAAEKSLSGGNFSNNRNPADAQTRE